MPLTKTQAEGINLADTFAFTGTISGASSGLVKLATQDITSASSAITFDNISSTYDSYRIIAHVVTDRTNNCKFRMSFRVSSTDVTSGVAIYHVNT